VRIILLLGLLFAVAACATNEQAEPLPTLPSTDDSLSSDTVSTPFPTEATRARAELQPTGGGGVEGTVDFARLDNGIRIVAFVRGLDDGRFALHIHEGHIYEGHIREGGSCARYGGHFNPSNAIHGGPESADGRRHVGDLGNIRSERGRARYDRIDTVLRMDSTDSIVGHVVAIHAGQDDLNTQPSGGSGDIAACGIIEAR